MREDCPLDDAGKSLLRAAMTQLGMSARAFHHTAQRPAIGEAGLRSVKLAGTTADPSTEGASNMRTHHLAEAIRCRPRRQI